MWDWNRVLTPHVVALMLPVIALVVWAYWQPIHRWEVIWRKDPDWGHGYLIPLIAILIAHYRLQELPPSRIRPCAWGLVPILAAAVLRIWAQSLMFSFPGQVTFILLVGGVVLWLLGWQVLRAVWVPVVYLLLMIPWERKYFEHVALPLQRGAAVATERFLSAFGMAVYRSGNILTLRSGDITVAEACSGLHLLFAFVALGVMMAYIYRRPFWQRAIIMGSSVPIAVFCNFIRVTLMAVASDTIFFEVGQLAAGQAGWSAYVPRIVAWSSSAWVGIILVLVGLALPLFRPKRLGRRDRILATIGLVVAGVIVVHSTAGLAVGYDTPDQLEAVRQTVLDPKSAAHQSFGFAMLGLAFVAMWAELKFIDMLFVAREESETGGEASTGAARTGSAGPASKTG